MNINVNDEEKLALRVKVKECLFTIPNPFGNSLCVMPSYEDVPEEVKLSKTSMNEFVLTWNTTFLEKPHINWLKTNNRVYMTGPATYVFRGEIEL